MNRRNLFVVVLAGLFTAAMSLVTTTPAWAKNGSKKKVEGILASVDLVNSQITITLKKGTTMVLTIPATAKIEHNEIPATLAAFEVGDEVEARFAADGTTVTKLEGSSPEADDED